MKKIFRKMRPTVQPSNRFKSMILYLSNIQYINNIGYLLDGCTRLDFGCTRLDGHFWPLSPFFARFWLKKCLVVLVGQPPTAIFLTCNFANSLEISNFTFAVGRLDGCTQK